MLTSNQRINTDTHASAIINYGTLNQNTGIIRLSVVGQKCPSYWYGYSVTSKCYRFMYQHMLSWQDARDICQIHGGDLLKLDSVSERVNNIKICRHVSKIACTTKAVISY